MHPLNNVVAHIHGINARRQHLHLKCVLVAGCLECLVPPPRTVQQRRAHRFRRTAIQVVDDRLDGFAYLRRRVDLFQSMTATVVDAQVFADGRRVVSETAGVVAQADYPTTRVVRQWFVVIVWKADKRMMNMNRHRARIRHNARQMLARGFTGESDYRLNLRVIRECLGARQVHCRTGSVNTVSSLAAVTNYPRHAMRIADEECGRINDRRSRGRITGMIDSLKAPNHRACK